MSRRLMQGLCCVLLAGAASCTASRVAADALVRPIRIPTLIAPPLAHRDISWKAADGIELRGWVFTAASSSPAGLVVFLHGKDANRTHFATQARRFTSRGFEVLAYDQRAHGSSEGQWCTYGAREVDDLQRAIDLLAPKGPVVVIGESMGAAVALQATAVEPRITGAVAAASFSDLSTVVKEHTPFFLSATLSDEAVTTAEQSASFSLSAISPVTAAAKIRVPVMLIHGNEDTFIPIAHSYRIHGALQDKAAPFVQLQGVDHQGVLQNDEAWSKIEAWFSTVVASCQSPAANGCRQ